MGERAVFGPPDSRHRCLRSVHRAQKCHKGVTKPAEPDHFLSRREDGPGGEAAGLSSFRGKATARTPGSDCSRTATPVGRGP